MALRNGLLVHGPTQLGGRGARPTPARSRRRRGASRACAPSTRSPGVRGVARLAEAMAVIPLVKRGAAGGAAAVPGPGRARGRGRRVARRHAAAPPAARRGRRGRRRGRLASCPRCSRCAAASWPPYHGVEHKAIGAYEADDEDARDATKEHERCGSHLVAPMLAANLAGTLLLRRAVDRPGPLAGGAVALASSAVAVEVFAWCERNAETRAARALKRPGFEIQRLVGTREPDERQLEVGRAALAEILRAEGASDIR